MLKSILPMIHKDCLWLVTEIASYCVNTGELFVNHNTTVILTTKQHNSILSQFRAFEVSAILNPLDVITHKAIGYIMYRFESDTFRLFASTRYIATEDIDEIINDFRYQYYLSHKYSRRKMRLCKAVFGVITEKNLSVLVTSKAETIH